MGWIFTLGSIVCLHRLVRAMGWPLRQVLYYLCPFSLQVCYVIILITHYFFYSKSCTLLRTSKSLIHISTENTWKHFKKLAPAWFGPYLRLSSGGSWAVLYVVTKLNSVDVRSSCSCTVCGAVCHNEPTSTEFKLVTNDSAAHWPPENGRKYGLKHVGASFFKMFLYVLSINPLNPELNPIW
jgi:hypothetical protein